MTAALTGISGFQPPIGIIAGPGTGVDPRDLPGAGVVQAAGSAITSIPDFLSFITDANTLIRLGEAIAGGVLIIGGLFLLGAKTDTGQTIVKTAGTAAKGAAL